MTPVGPTPLPFDAPVEAWDRRADELLGALRRGDEGARYAFRWHHPALADRSMEEVAEATSGFGPADARRVVASIRGFESWDSMAAFAVASAVPGPARAFEEAVEALVGGDLEALRTRLAEDPELVYARSTRRHGATLLHYVAANGVEDARQRTPPTALEIAELLLDAGAEVDATADAYGGPCTTLHLLVSSAHPADAGLQADLAVLLVARGARIDGPDGGPSAVDVALSFGYRDTALRLVAEGAPVDRFSTAAGLGLREKVRAGLASASAGERHRALALAAGHGHAEVVGDLLEAGEDPDRFNPAGVHPHSTPLHQAAWAGHTAVVERLLAAGARRDRRDTVYGGTASEWAAHAGHTGIADRLAVDGVGDDAR